MQEKVTPPSDMLTHCVVPLCFQAARQPSGSRIYRRDTNKDRNGQSAGRAHHPAVAPEAAGVHEADARPGRVRQQPHLRRQRVLALPLIDAQR